MSSFIASPTPPVSPDGDEVAAGTFWPAIDVNRFRDTMRIGGQAIPEPRVREALLGGVIIVDDNLMQWRADHVAAGRETLAAVPSEALGTETRLVILWRRAVHAFAAADLIETHRDVTATATSVRDTEIEAMTPGDHRRNGVHAIRAMLGQRRTSVELI